MFLFDEPSPQRIVRFLDAQRDAPFSYDEVGASREGAKTPLGFAVDYNRVKLGRGRETFERAVVALYSWRMFDVGWARLVPADAPVEVGTTVAVLEGKVQIQPAQASAGQASVANYLASGETARVCI